MSDTATRRLCGHNHTSTGAGMCQTLAKMRRKAPVRETPIFDELILEDKKLDELYHKLTAEGYEGSRCWIHGII